jgi:hypothetical protein
VAAANRVSFPTHVPMAKKMLSFVSLYGKRPRGSISGSYVQSISDKISLNDFYILLSSERAFGFFMVFF